jgi:uncharacterized membrane protein YebE (DUF533 family)
MKARINYQVFLALATVAWANGDLAPEERAGILSAARYAGYSDGELSSLSKAIETPRELSSLSLHRLTALDRVFIFATAEWLARLDGVVEQSEVAALAALGDFLKLSEQVRVNARRAALEIAQLPSGDRPDRYDLVKLRELIEGTMRAAWR